MEGDEDRWPEKVKGLYLDPLKIESARVREGFRIKTMVLITTFYQIPNSSFRLIGIKTCALVNVKSWSFADGI